MPNGPATTRVRSLPLQASTAATLTAVLLANAHATEQDEINKQIAKLTSDAISARLTGATVASLTAPGAATPNNAWASYTNLGLKFRGDDGSNLGTVVNSSSTTDIVMLGYDRDVSGPLTVGAALSTAKTRRASGDTWGLSPYLAYRFSENHFAIGRLGYSRSEGGGFTSESYSVGASLNTVQPFGDFLLKGEAGAGATHAKSRGGGFASRSDDVFNWMLSGEAAYKFGNGWMAFAGLNVGGADDSHTTRLNGSIGIEKAFSTNGAIQLKYETNLADDLPGGFKADTNAVTLSARWRF